ncbi:DinB family protein [Niabella soli]|nr:DinB family protein [Niabella soli]
MTKQYFKELAAFNEWANTLACGWIDQLTDEQWNRTVVSSFTSIRDTVLHMISAENAWVERFQKRSEVRWLQTAFEGSKAAHVALWKQTSAAFQTFIEGFDEALLYTPLDFKRQNGEAHSIPYYQLFAHVVNHATYHRGQLVTLLRQVGFTGVQSTDLMGFYRLAQQRTESSSE